MDKVIAKLFPGTVVRLATVDDLDAIDVLDKKKPDPNRTTPRLVIEKRITNEVCLVLQQGKEIIAYTMLLVDGERCEAAKLVSLDNSLPILQSAIKETANWLKSTGVKKLVSRCRKDLLPFYKRFGFQNTGVLPHFFGFNNHAIAIELIL